MSEEVLKRIEDLEARVKKLEEVASTPGAIQAGKARKMGIAEFLREKQPVSNLDKALAIAVFHETHNGAQSFTTEDILALWRQAKESLPTNINDVINKNVMKERGYMAEEVVGKGEKKKWYVTSTGVGVVEKGFSK